MSEEQMRAEFWKRHPFQKAKLDDPKYDSSHIMGKLAEFERGWQAALSAKSVPEQMGSPIQKLMEYLTNILDEDEFNQCDSILAGQGISAPQPTDDKVRELEKDAARYRWLRDHYPGFASYRSGVIPYVNLDSEVDKQIAYRKRSHE